MSHEQHQSSAKDIVVRCLVITLSDTRDESSDTSGAKIREQLIADHHKVVDYKIIPDDPAILGALLNDIKKRDDVDAILTNGGTGISRRDQTVNVVEKMLDVRLPGFGELFRMLSYEQIQSAAMLSRAVAGVMAGKLLFTMPGSTKAVDLAITKLIIPQLRHLVFELRK